MRHDLWSYKVSDPTDRGRPGAPLGREALSGLDCFTAGEIRTICEAIGLHLINGELHRACAELPKVGDVLQLNTYNIQFEATQQECERSIEMCGELAIEHAVAPTQHSPSEI